ncbi:hypothetical protein N7474_004406 [Penicillium riverlandense]|uniref:uncharacterized protein n=1 Tax=Penicillium riverlandense TaxID=1903569 RepID=UPI002548EAED|nr:uncharacterized protein N7474_004406 [Penicillium riverlandense]KAJ5818815.1 hypothetical protein N7474_004406 [Penicillium riverlandense]
MFRSNNTSNNGLNNNEETSSIHGRNGSFLADLPAPIHRYVYRGRQQLEDVYNREFDRFSHDQTGQLSQFVLFSNIDEQTFARDFRERTVSWTSYSAYEQLLLIKMVTDEHAAASEAFHDILMDAIRPMGLAKAVKRFGGASRPGKQADKAYGPHRPPPGCDRYWPTVVLEVAVSEPASKLTSDIRHWFGKSEGKVNIVLTIRVDRKRPFIAIEKWEMAEDRMNRTQVVELSKRKKGDEKTTVSGAPLLIEFDKLFRRAPEPPRESDIRMGQDGLSELASSVWVEQEF